MAGNRGKRGPGRPKGAVNKTTAEAKEAIAMAFEGIGGQKAFEAWAKENQSVYYGQIFPKLLPVQVKHGNDPESGPFVLQVVKQGHA